MSVSHCRHTTNDVIKVGCVHEFDTVCVCVQADSSDDCKLNVGSEWPLMSLVQTRSRECEATEVQAQVKRIAY